MVIDHQGQVSYHPDVTAAASEPVIDGFHAAESLFLLGSTVQIVAADNHNTGFFDHLQLWTRGAGFTVRELEETGNTYFETACVAASDRASRVAARTSATPST